MMKTIRDKKPYRFDFFKWLDDGDNFIYFCMGALFIGSMIVGSICVLIKELR